MSHNFLLVHFGSQCPWRDWAIEQARQAAEQLGCDIDVVDVERDHAEADHYRLFFPFMTVIDSTLRLAAPMRASDLVRAAIEGISPNEARLQPPRPERRASSIHPLTSGDIEQVCFLCAPPAEARGCRAKAAWAAQIDSHVSHGVLGYAAYEGDEPAGAVEFYLAPWCPTHSLKRPRIQPSSPLFTASKVTGITGDMCSTTSRSSYPGWATIKCR